MKRFWKVFGTILMIAVALTELAAAGFYLSRVPYRLHPVKLDPAEIECVRVQEYGGGVYSAITIAEFTLKEEPEIEKLTEYLNACRIPRERHTDRYLMLGGGEDVFLFQMKDGSTLRVSWITGSPLLYIRENEKPAKVYHLGEEEVYELDEWFTFYIKQSFWYQK